ncbi:MAG: DUF5069 domain-containing protein [Candidatus Eremiobacteraeota bacterium]|nr:DUF5069 domain-containing protein [Candidatus Eremiobacteraeota bacterium]
MMLLPRAIDKARAYIAGTLGDYTYCGCSVNAQLFETLGITEDEFLEAVRTAKDDEDVAAWVRDRVRPDPARIAEMNDHVTHDSHIDDIAREEGHKA